MANTLQTFDHEKAFELVKQGWVCEEKKELHNKNWCRPEKRPVYETVLIYECVKPPDRKG
jgi:hypothetical protein